MTLTFTCTAAAFEAHFTALLSDSHMVAGSQSEQEAWIAEALDYCGISPAEGSNSFWGDIIGWFRGKVGSVIGLFDDFYNWWQDNFGDLVWGTITGPFPFPASWGSGAGPGL